MSGSQLYNLFFKNQSGLAGNVVVYQNLNNILANQGNIKVLAWMLTGANPTTQVDFTWSTDYNFAWFDYGSPKSQQIINCNPGESVPFSCNQFGYNFQPPPTDIPGDSLQIKSDNTIPTVNNTVVGISMHGAGTFAFASGPNLTYVLTPAQDGNLAYWISFGNYTFEVNDPIDVSTLNSPGCISFPGGIYAVTAVLNSQNAWQIFPGMPAIGGDETVVFYEAGRGVLSRDNA
jgi:rhizosphere induced protein